MADLSECDAPVQGFVDKINAKLVISYHSMPMRKIEFPVRTSGLNKSITIGFYIKDPDKEWGRENIQFYCNCCAYSDSDGERKIWNDFIWRGDTLPNDYLALWDMLESAENRLKCISEDDLSPVEYPS